MNNNIVSFFLKLLLNFENLGAKYFSIKSLKKRFANIYKSVAPIVVDKTAIIIPHHYPNTKPANNNKGVAKPKNNVQTIENIKKEKTKNK